MYVKLFFHLSVYPSIKFKQYLSISSGQFIIRCSQKVRVSGCAPIRDEPLLEPWASGDFPYILYTSVDDDTDSET